MKLEEQQHTILIVDDNHANLDLLRGTLSNLGHKILAANNGETAIKIAEKSKPELILLDIMMPEVDGFEVCERLKETAATRDIAIIFLSALDKLSDKVRGLELGAVDYITKPFQPLEVIARVNTHLRVKELEKSLREHNLALKNINKQLNDDLLAAAKVQQSMLPTSSIAKTNAEFAWRYHPCKLLAGDSLNFFQINERYLAAYLLDVSGHGVASSLLSVSVSRAISEFRDQSSLILNHTDKGRVLAKPSEVAQRLNNLFPMSENGQHFFTLVYGIYDTHSLEFEFVTCGHPGPVWIKSNGKSEVLESPSLPIGIMKQTNYEDQKINLGPADRLLMYSDGICEQRNDRDDEYGIDNVISNLSEHKHSALGQSLDMIIDSLSAWCHGKPFSDDVSMLMLGTASDAKVTHDTDSSEYIDL